MKRESLERIFKVNFLIYVSIVVTLFIIIELVSMYSFIQFIKKENFAKTQLIADTISTAVSFRMNEDVVEILKSLDYKETFESIYVFDRDGNVISHAGHSQEYIDHIKDKSIGPLGTKVHIDIISSGEIVGELHIDYHLYFLLDKIAFDLVISILLIGLLIFILYRSSVSIHRSIIRPITSLTEIVMKIASSNNLHQIIDVKEFGESIELYELSSQFNHMLHGLSLGQLEVEESKRVLEKVNRDLEKIVEAKTQKLNETIRNLKNYQNKLISQEKLASMGTLAAGIAHEIKNPLNLINNSAGLIEAFIREDLPDYIESIKKGDFEDKEQYFKEDISGITNACSMIVKNGGRADSIIRNLLAQSRSEKLTPENVNLRELVDEYFNLSFHAMRANMAMNVQRELKLDDVGNVSVIPQDIGRAITNILDNSFYSMQEKLSEFGGDYMPAISVTLAKRKEKFAAITIKDNGKGITDGIGDQIFEPFFTTKPTGLGTGLGLSMVFDIIRSHQGEISVQTEAEEFTVFTILLPLHTQEKGND